MAVVPADMKKHGLSKSLQITELSEMGSPDDLYKGDWRDKDMIHINGKSARRNSIRHHQLLLTEVLLDFASNTTLHGLKYISEKGLSLIERLFWIATFIMSVVLCSLLIRNVWKKWDTSPIIVTIGEKMVHVSEVPLPAVTICPARKCMPSKYNFTFFNEKYKAVTKATRIALDGNLYVEGNEFENLTLQELRMHQDVEWICDVSTDVVSDLAGILYSDETVVNNIISVSPSLSDMFLSCKFREIFYDCERIFKAVLTRQGLCYSFNLLAFEEMFVVKSLQPMYEYIQLNSPMTLGWTVEDGYDDNVRDPYPYRGKESDRYDLNIVLKTRPEDFDQMCNIVTDGFEVYLHHPVDMPSTPVFHYNVAINQTISLGAKINKMTTTNNLKGYSYNLRQCYFPEDRPLVYFKHYTESNCRLELLANVTFERCNCVVFYMPHYSNQICTKLQKECVLLASFDLANDHMSVTSSKLCLPLCNSIKYDAEVTKGEFLYRKLMKNTYNLTTLFNQKMPDSEGYNDFSLVSLYFKEPHFLAMQRSQLFGLTDFLANIGGLLGLFLGFSFLSFIEIFYYITLRSVLVGVILEWDRNGP